MLICNSLWLYPGQTNYVAVDIVVPLDIPDASVNTLTLSILGTEIPEKTVNIYVQKYAISKIKVSEIIINYVYNVLQFFICIYIKFFKFKEMVICEQIIQNNIRIIIINKLCTSYDK